MKQWQWSLLVFVLITAYVLYFAERYTLGFSAASTRCLEQRFFLVDTWNKDIKQGDLVAFIQPRETQYFPAGLNWIKIAAAPPNSTIDIEQHQVTINGEKPIPLDMTIIVDFLVNDNAASGPEDFIGTFTTSEDEWFVLGETLVSYDSRFWGNIKSEYILGKAYAIF